MGGNGEPSSLPSALGPFRPWSVPYHPAGGKGSANRLLPQTSTPCSQSWIGVNYSHQGGHSGGCAVHRLWAEGSQCPLESPFLTTELSIRDHLPPNYAPRLILSSPELQSSTQACNRMTSGSLRYNYFLISSHQSSPVSNNSLLLKMVPDYSCLKYQDWENGCLSQCGLPQRGISHKILPLDVRLPWTVAGTVSTSFWFAISVHFLSSVNWLLLFSLSLPARFSPLLHCCKAQVLSSSWCEFIHNSYFRSCCLHILVCCILTLTQLK